MNSTAQVVPDIPYWRSNAAGNKVPGRLCRCQCGMLVDRPGSDFVYGHRKPWLIKQGQPVQRTNHRVRWMIVKKSEDRPGMNMFFCKEEGKRGHWVYMNQFAMQFRSRDAAQKYVDRFEYRNTFIQSITVLV